MALLKDLGISFSELRKNVLETYLLACDKTPEEYMEKLLKESPDSWDGPGWHSNLWNEAQHHKKHWRNHWFKWLNQLDMVPIIVEVEND